MSMARYNKSIKNAAERADVEVAKRVRVFSVLTTEEIRAKLEGGGATPWERTALRRILFEREQWARG